MTAQHPEESRPAWRKSSHSASNGGQCVEVAQNMPSVVAVRDSRDPGGPRLAFTPTAWAAFLRTIKRDAA